MLLVAHNSLLPPTGEAVHHPRLQWPGGWLIRRTVAASRGLSARILKGVIHGNRHKPIIQSKACTMLRRSWANIRAQVGHPVASAKGQGENMRKFPLARYSMKYTSTHLIAPREKKEEGNKPRWEMQLFLVIRRCKCHVPGC